MRTTLLICFFFLQIACQPMEYGNFSSVGTLTEEEDNGLLSPEIDEYLFMNDKLDLVFVIDSHPDMRHFYQKQLFGQNFLSRFEAYDWRFAYTNMSVDPDTREKLTQEEDEEDECLFFSSLLWTVFGVFSEGMITTARGLKGLGRCVSSIGWPDFSTENFADGRFLPFEHKGEKWEPEGGNCLTKSVENYNNIFEDSFQLNNNKEDTTSPFDAPNLMEEDQKSYPLQALLLSFAEGAGIAESEQEENNGQTAEGAQEASSMTKRTGALVEVESEQEETSGQTAKKALEASLTAPAEDTETSALETCQAFFRPDSVIVYVLITTNDIDPSSDTLLQNFQHSLDASSDSVQRLKLISVSIGPRSSLLCGLPAGTQFSTTPKIRQLSQKTRSRALDLCSKDLPDKLFEEITRSPSLTDSFK